MITRIHIQNYRSFVDAEVSLRPFSLVIGANGSGKSSFLGALSVVLFHSGESPRWNKHGNHQTEVGRISVDVATGQHRTATMIKSEATRDGCTFGVTRIPIFNLDPSAIAGTEGIEPVARIREDGTGTAQVLEYLKNGDREDLFDEIESHFRRQVPEVEKVSLKTVKSGTKQIQVRERGLKESLPASELSEGTRLILCILTIIHQEKPPPVILLEDIDRGMHPRIFEQMVPLMRGIAEKHDINIIATTHNPFLVDCFEDDPEAVIIVEKKDGASTLSTLASRLEGLDYDKVDPEEMPLGNLWYSGLVGGVPLRSRFRQRREAQA